MFLLFLTAGFWIYRLFSAIKLAVYKKTGKEVRAVVTRKEISTKSFLGRSPTLVSFTGDDGLIYEKNYIFGAEDIAEGQTITIFVKIGGDSFAVENINKNE